jgi:WD40 repeat protein
MKSNTLNLIIFTITTTMIAFVSFITIEIYNTTVHDSVDAKEELNVNNTKLYYSPDGKYLAFTDNYKLKIFEVKSTKKIQEFSINGDPGIVFSPDSKSIAFIGSNKIVKMFNLVSGKDAKTFDIGL